MKPRIGLTDDLLVPFISLHPQLTAKERVRFGREGADVERMSNSFVFHQTESCQPGNDLGRFGAWFVRDLEEYIAEGRSAINIRGSMDERGNEQGAGRFDNKLRTTKQRPLERGLLAYDFFGLRDTALLPSGLK